MENEGWRICPVKSNFTHLNLHEFRFLRPSISSKENQPLDSPSSPTLGSVRGFFEKFSEKGSPFDKQVVDESKGTGAVNGVSHKVECQEDGCISFLKIIGMIVDSPPDLLKDKCKIFCTYACFEVFLLQGATSWYCILLGY